MNINYWDLKGQDIVYMMRSKLQKHGWGIRGSDGMIARTHETIMNELTPWYHIKTYPNCDCETYHLIIFDTILKDNFPKEQWFVPSRCHQCWKIVVRPNDLKGLMALIDIMHDMDVPSKAGFEQRPKVKGCWGGYYYTASKEEGLERYKEVRSRVNNCAALGPDVKVLLKRGCTEFEEDIPHSSTWEVTEMQLKIEELVDLTVDTGPNPEQKKIQKIHVLRQMIEVAYSMGEDVSDWTDGQDLYPDYETYHDVEELNV